MAQAVRNAVKVLGLPLPDALAMATAVPARVAGIQGRKGRIEPGMDADLVVLDRELRVTLVVVEGEVVRGAETAG